MRCILKVWRCHIIFFLYSRMQRRSSMRNKWAPWHGFGNFLSVIVVIENVCGVWKDMTSVNRLPSSHDGHFVHVALFRNWSNPSVAFAKATCLIVQKNCGWLLLFHGTQKRHLWIGIPWHPRSLSSHHDIVGWFTFLERPWYNNKSFLLLFPSVVCGEAYDRFLKVHGTRKHHLWSGMTPLRSTPSFTVESRHRGRLILLHRDHGRTKTICIICSPLLVCLETYGRLWEFHGTRVRRRWSVWHQYGSSFAVESWRHEFFLLQS